MSAIDLLIEEIGLKIDLYAEKKNRLIELL